MAVFFAAGELEAYTVSSTNVYEIAAGGTFDPAYARCSIYIPNPAGDYILSPIYTSATTSWTHFECYLMSIGGATQPLIELYNSSSTAVFRVLVGASVIQAQYWSGSAWTNIGASVPFVSAALYTFDLKVVCGASGSFELYVNSSLFASGSASMTAVTNIAQHKFLSRETASYTSQVICADVSTVGWKYYLRPPTGDGANTAFTGSYVDVDELVTSNSDYIESTSANEIETFTRAAITLTPGVVKAVTVSARALNVASGPQNLQLALRRGSTNYFSSNVSGIGTGFNPFVVVWETDPSTSAAWTRTDAAAATTEFGAKSIT